MKTRFMLLFPLLIAGCLGGSGGGGSFQGAGVLRGFVTEFEAGGQVFQGGVEGVTVTVGGTGLEATTADDGFFILSGVPPQQNTLTFSFLDTVATLSVTVPENAEVDLRQVRIREGEVKADDIEVTQLPPPVQAQEGPGADDDSPGPSGSTGSSDNSGSGSSNSGSGSDDDNDNRGSGGSDDDDSGSGSVSSGSGSSGSDDDEEEDEEDESDDFEVEGLIQSISGSRVTVNGVTFIVNASTEIRDEEGDALPLSGLQPGEDVEVKGEIVAGNAIATRVRRRD